MRSERKIGVVPEWTKIGPIDGRNYCYRAEEHCARKSGDRGGLHPTIARGSDDFRLWLEYFDRHLRKRPAVFQMLIDSDIAEMSVPEARPMWFDPSLLPNPTFVPDVSCDPNLEAAKVARRKAEAAASWK